MKLMKKSKKLAKPVENNKKTTGKMLGGVTGKGFKPGESGNPGGRPKGLITTALLKQLLRKAAKGSKSDLQAIVEAIIATAKNGNAKAFCAIRDTVDGPPKQESQARGRQVLVQFTRDPQTPAIQVPSKPAI